ncbi:MAG: hypothetical protein R3Y19_01890, partial [Rikenellaceae bacterium]
TVFWFSPPPPLKKTCRDFDKFSGGAIKIDKDIAMFSDARATCASLEVQGSRGGASALLNFLRKFSLSQLNHFVFLFFWDDWVFSGTLLGHVPLKGHVLRKSVVLLKGDGVIY